MSKVRKGLKTTTPFAGIIGVSATEKLHKVHLGFSHDPVHDPTACEPAVCLQSPGARRALATAHRQARRTQRSLSTHGLLLVAAPGQLAGSARLVPLVDWAR